MTAAKKQAMADAPRVPIVVGETKRGKALIAAHCATVAALREAANKAHMEANKAAVLHGVDARPGSRARVKRRDDDPKAWDAVARAFARAEAADAAWAAARAAASDSPDAIALRLLDAAITGVHLDARLRAAPCVFDFVTAIRNVVMAAQPGMTFKELMQPFYVNGGGRPPKVDQAAVERTRTALEQAWHPAWAQEAATQHGISARYGRKIAAKKKPG